MNSGAPATAPPMSIKVCENDHKYRTQGARHRHLKVGEASPIRPMTAPLVLGLVNRSSLRITRSCKSLQPSDGSPVEPGPKNMTDPTIAASAQTRHSSNLSRQPITVSNRHCKSNFGSAQEKRHVIHTKCGPTTQGRSSECGTLRLRVRRFCPSLTSVEPASASLAARGL